MISILTYIQHIGWPIVALFAFFLLNPFDLGYLAGYLLVPIIYTRGDFIKTNLDSSFFILFIFSVVYALFYSFDPNMHIQTFVFYMFFPPTFYLLGKYFVIKTKTVRQLYILFFIVACLYSFTALASVALNLVKGGFAQYDRTIGIFWNGRLVTATLMAAFFTYNMCIPTLLLIPQKKIKLVYKLGAVGIFIISLLCTFRLGSRTQLAICMLSIVMGLLFIIPKQSIKQNLKLFAFMIIMAFALLKFVSFDLDADYLSVLGNRLQESEDTGTAGNRSQRWAKSLANLFTKPFGWERTEFGYSHNLWLDVAQSTGLLPFILLLLFTIKSSLKIVKVILVKNQNLPFQTMVITYFMATHLLFFVEPVMLGAFYMFVLFCFFQGATNVYAKNWLNNETISSPEQDSKLVQ
ncbi:hypothetical protein [Kriegella aquimaris]|uniref:O-antigen ligase n=1 Tax=Kriegella aquimaris TaxID=192904 RepID=A0A1G9JTT2_9FLAO|nr:hypothetical protein [Kriegella aquimaris]SDL40293.1 hypothetical protein SAMN04488514_101687 [Kriegella aquimaris]